MNNFDCVVVGKILNTGTFTKKATGEVKPWTDVYTPRGTVVRVYGYAASEHKTMDEVNLHCFVRIFDGQAYVSLSKELK